MRNKSLFIFLFLLTVIPFSLVGQVGINTEDPHPSSYLDIVGNKGGFLPPRMTETERDDIIKPATGLIIYNTQARALEQNTGTEETPVWKSLSYGPNWFYMPGTPLDVTESKEYTLDLYQEYYNQFINTPVLIYKREDLEYYVLGYDHSVFIDVTLDQTGILTYTVDPMHITSATYFNVIFLIK